MKNLLSFVVAGHFINLKRRHFFYLEFKFENFRIGYFSISERLIPCKL
jgi:hypothetical protein